MVNFSKKVYTNYCRARRDVPINRLDHNFTLILLASFLLAFSKIKVPESSVEIWERYKRAPLFRFQNSASFDIIQNFGILLDRNYVIFKDEGLF